MVKGYSHGPTNCQDCFMGTEKTLAIGDWRLHNNPGYYGSSVPQILVLGFSKGANQNKTAEEDDFDKIAFAKARHRLQQILDALGIMPTDRDIDTLMTSKEQKYGFASLVRCSFCKMKSGICKTSGDVIPASFANPATLKIIKICSEKYLGKLPRSVELVVLLGTSETYIRRTTALFRGLYQDFKIVNHVSFKAGGVLWLYATHPSPGNGNFKAWVNNGAEDISGNKRLLALKVLSENKKNNS